MPTIYSDPAHLQTVKDFADRTGQRAQLDAQLTNLESLSKNREGLQDDLYIFPDFAPMSFYFEIYRSGEQRNHKFRLWNGDTDLTAMLRMLESFGTLRVLSSPKISVLNNQSSVLKVVDNKVYFTLTVTPGTAATSTTPATAATYSTTATTVPIGFLMSVVPQISEGNEITLNLRPTISRITGYVNDPNPDLAKAGVSNRVPEVQTREMESMMRVQSGDIAILGGLMQDSRDKTSDEIPGLNNLPSIGNLFKYRNETSKKSELVIFLRPTVLTDASLNGDFRDYRANLPTTINEYTIW